MNTPARYAAGQVLVQKLAAWAPASWLLAHFLRHADRLALRISGGRWTLTNVLAGLPVITITTTGARSGLPRTHTLTPIRDPDGPGRFALMATNFGQHHFPAWYFNLKANPRAVCVIEGRAVECVAHEAVGEEYDRFCAYAVATYRGYALYKQRAHRRIPVMVMEM